MRKKFKQPFLNTETTVILWANWFQFAPGEKISNPCVLSRMLLWCQEGRGRVRVNGHWHTMEPDDFLFLPWGHEVQYAADAREPFRVAGIHLIPDHTPDRKLVFSVSHHGKDTWARCKWRRDIAWPGLEGTRAGHARPLDPLRLLGAYIIERFEKGALSEKPLRMLSQLLVAEIARTLSEKPIARTGNDVVRRVQEHVGSHWSRQIPLIELARLAQCSVSTLRRQFQEALGIPPYEWILQARIRRAQQLLGATSLRIKEIAAQVGFEDPFQFSRTFKQRIGSSPRQYRQAHAFAPK